MTTISRVLRKDRRPRFLGAVIAFAMLTAGACDSSPTQSTPVVEGGAGAPATTQAAAATLPPITDPAAVLGNALATLAGGYGFNVTVMVGGEVATSVQGRTVGITSEMTISSLGADLEYLTSGDRQWAREEGGEWAVLDGAAPADNPIDGLSSPLSVTVVENRAQSVILEGIYDRAALGLVDDEPVPVRFTIVDGFLATIDYVADTGGVALAVSTALTPLADSTPITLPPEEP